MREIRILHVITRLDRGGSSDCTLLQAIGAARRGHQVTLACGPSLLPSPLLEEARARTAIIWRTPRGPVARASGVAAQMRRTRSCSSAPAITMHAAPVLPVRAVTSSAKRSAGQRWVL